MSLRMFLRTSGQAYAKQSPQDQPLLIRIIFNLEKGIFAGFTAPPQSLNLYCPKHFKAWLDNQLGDIFAGIDII